MSKEEISNNDNENFENEKINNNNMNKDNNDKKENISNDNNNELNNNDSINNENENNINDKNDINTVTQEMDSIFDDDISFKSNENNEDDSDNEMDDPYAGYMPLNGYCLLDDDDDNENDNENLETEDEERKKKLQEEMLKKNKLIIETTKEDEIPEDDLNVINSVMAKISIPDSSIPEWAKQIPESLWMPEVIKK